MNTLLSELEGVSPSPVSVEVSGDTLSVTLEDGRIIVVPTSWYPRLDDGSLEEQANFELGFFGIHWPDLDEDISVAGLLLGRKSTESKRSLDNWLEQRQKNSDKSWHETNYKTQKYG